MVEAVWLIPALPLAGFVFLVLFGRRLGEPVSGWVATAAITGSFAATVAVFVDLIGRDEHDRVFNQVLFEWVPVGGFSVDFGFLVDPLAISMCFFITGVGAVIHLYSIGYMHGDAHFSKFFVYLNLFAFSMLMLVLGDNMLLTFLGWEGVGACSYFLISFWFSDEANATAGKKAFVTNRVGDWGFMVAMFLIFATIGSLQYVDVLAAAPGLAESTATGITVLLLVAAAGKSAQLPLYLWLPDAMAGPTPVSALIHAATMVTSGVYLLTRMNPVLDASADWAPMTIAWVGALTALFAATVAVAQTDIKKVLAYSTVSQLGYMFLAVGLGGYVAAVFHMITHACFKALLFLGSGSVIHGMEDDQDMRHYGGLARFMPITAITFIIGWLAIAGVPPFSGFWSKDEVLLIAFDHGGAGIVLWVIAVLVALLTAVYMTRQVVLTFFGRHRYGDPRPDELPDDAAPIEYPALYQPPKVAADAELAETVAARREHHPHESGWLMTGPLVLLAGLAAVAGLLNLPFGGWHQLESFLEPSLFGNEAHIDAGGWTKVALAAVATITALVGIAIGAAAYLRNRIPYKPFEQPVLARGWYYDETVSSFMGGPGRRAFEAIAWFDATIVDGAVNGAGRLVQAASTGVRRVQNGFVRSYAALMAGGAVVLMAYFVLRSSL